MLTERFKKFLEQQFRLISPTKEAMEYRLEVLQNLLDRAQEYKIKGMTDEDAIFDLCIDSLGDFKSTLTEFENKLDNVKKAAPKVGAIALTGIAIALFVVIGYLAVSFATKAWADTWLILVGGVFIGIIAGAIFGIVKFAKKKKYIPVRILSQVIVVLVSVFLFLVLQILVGGGKPYWLTFLMMVVAILFTDTTLAFAFNSKTRYIALLATVEVTSVMVYVMLGFLGGLWNPYWLIPVVGVVVDIAIAVGALLNYSKKKEKREAEKKERQKEEYYTMWNDEK